MVHFNGSIEVISSHEQILDNQGMRFLGCKYPARKDYRKEIEILGEKAGHALLKNNIYGIFSADFLVVKKDQEFSISLIELNIRKGGTTHPFWTCKLALGETKRSESSGHLVGKDGKEYIYCSNDNYEGKAYGRCSIKEILNNSKNKNLIFSTSRGEGVIFHLLSAWEPLGKIGYTIIAQCKERLQEIECELDKVLSA